MNTSQDHIVQAERNEVLFHTLHVDLQSHDDWQVTLIFYAALHYVDAFLHQIPPSPGIHPGGHRIRTQAVNLHLGAPVLEAYSRLRLLSEAARYEGGRFAAEEIASLYTSEFARIRMQVRAALGLPV